MKKRTNRIAKNRMIIALRKAENGKRLTVKDNKSLTRLLVALGGAFVISCASCSGYTISCYGDGCREFNNHAVGIITETKNPAPKKSSYWQAQENDTNRLTWMESLFGKKGGR